MDLAINLDHVAKTYKGLFGRGAVDALRGIEMKVHRGEVFGLLGPNGAGKSTLVKILMTVIRPTRCAGSMLGEPVGKKDILTRVGYLPEHHSFPPYLTGRQLIEFFGAMSKVNRRDRRRRSGELLELVGMDDWANKKLGGYSKGMRQRVGLAQALVNDPELVLLDEPTDGVDPVGRRDIREILERLRDQGKTVFVNSHILSELELVCSRVAILVQGSVAQQGTIDELTEGQRRYDIALDGEPGPAGETMSRALGRVQAAHGGTLPTGERIEIAGDTLSVASEDPNLIQPILDAIRAEGGVIRSISQTRPSLEDLFMQAVVDPETGQALALGAKRGKDGRR